MASCLAIICCIGKKTLITLKGGGTFEVANGELITQNGNAIEVAAMSTINIIVSGTGKVQTEGKDVHAIISNDGNVEVKDDAVVSGTNGEVIATYGQNSIVTVSGGTVSATNENAIIASKVQSVEIFDVYGKKLKAESRKRKVIPTILRSYGLPYRRLLC